MFIAEFAKVSSERFRHDCEEMLGSYDIQWYDDIILPKRATAGSAGYDFYSPYDILIKKRELYRLPTGIRVKINKGYFMSIYPRSSMGLKYQLCLANTVGIIDADYYCAQNEGHIICALVNRGDKDCFIAKGDRIVQGILTKYYLAQEEEVSSQRIGGYGSSGK